MRVSRRLCDGTSVVSVALTAAEHDTLLRRLSLLVAGCLGDVVLDLSPDALGVCLGDSDAR